MEENAVETSQETLATETPQVEFHSRYGDDSVKDFFEKNGIKDEASLGKWAVNANSMLGKKGLLPPGENATDEQRQEFRDQVYSALGVPENGEYEFDLPESVPQDIADSETGQQFRNELAEVAFKNGMNPQGFQELINTIYNAYSQDYSEMQGRIQELQSKLGENGTMNDEGNNKNVSKATIENEYKNLIREHTDLKMANKHAEAAEVKAKFEAMRKYIDN